MVTITELGKQKNKNNFNLFVDGQFYASINKETAIANNFFVGKTIEKDALDKIVFESQTKQAFLKGIDYVTRQVLTQKQLYQKLVKKYSDEASRLAIQKLSDYGYINDQAYVQSVLKSNKQGKLVLKQKLFSSGIDKQTIDDALATVSDQTELENAIMLAKKYLKTKDLQQNKQKVYAHLLRHGFSYSVAKQAIERLGANFDEWEE